MKPSFHHLIMSQQAMIHKLLLTNLKPTGLTIGQPKVLEFLLDHVGLEQKDIARGCHIEPGTMTTLLNRMEQANLIERRSLHGNRRSFYIYLTEEGRQKALLVKASFEKIETTIFSSFSKEEKETLMKLMQRVYENTKGESLHE